MTIFVERNGVVSGDDFVFAIPCTLLFFPLKFRTAIIGFPFDTPLTILH
jgi:hypothetical protein